MTEPRSLFEGVAPPPPPPWLRSRSLEAAARALAPPPPSLVDRLWESRGLRWGWLGTVVLLLALCTVPGSDPGATKDSRSRPANLPSEWSTVVGRRPSASGSTWAGSLSRNGFADSLEGV